MKDLRKGGFTDIQPRWLFRPLLPAAGALRVLEALAGPSSQTRGMTVPSGPSNRLLEMLLVADARIPSPLPGLSLLCTARRAT